MAGTFFGSRIGYILIGLLMSPYAAAQQGQSDARHILQTPLPTGPYASWPEESKMPALAALRFRCTMMSVMALGASHSPKEAAQEQGKGIADNCVTHQMPSDWPNLAETRETARHHFEAAHQLDGNIEIPASEPPSP
ncbi:MAG: hypothetical protein WCC64_06685 [Aliidongia sp.]